MWKFPGSGSNRSCSCQPTPQPQPQQPHQIPAGSVTHTEAQSNTRVLTHWKRPGIEPASSWILVRFITAEPQQELQKPIFMSVHYSLLTCFPINSFQTTYNYELWWGECFPETEWLPLVYLQKGWPTYNGFHMEVKTHTWLLWGPPQCAGKLFSEKKKFFLYCFSACCKDLMFDLVMKFPFGHFECILK